ncbi:hypothetical protein B0T10DRAFT_492602, partial [Thelonectria olida]
MLRMCPCFQHPLFLVVFSVPCLSALVPCPLPLRSPSLSSRARVGLFPRKAQATPANKKRTSTKHGPLCSGRHSDGPGMGLGTLIHVSHTLTQTYIVAACL